MFCLHRKMLGDWEHHPRFLDFNKSSIYEQKLSCPHMNHHESMSGCPLRPKRMIFPPPAARHRPFLPVPTDLVPPEQQFWGCLKPKILCWV